MVIVLFIINLVIINFIVLMLLLYLYISSFINLCQNMMNNFCGSLRYCG